MRRTGFLVALAVSLSLVTGGSTAAAATPPAAPPALSPAATALADLPVKGRAPKTGYSRDAFGQRWADTDRDGCDQRNQVLARDLTNVTRRGQCVVLTGTLHDPYTGRDIAFVRGETTSDDVQIEHVVALSNAWQTGAQLLSAAERLQLANDLLELLAVDGPTNLAKGDADSATWLPPNKAYRCPYVARQIAVKTKYRLWVTAPERDAIAAVLTGCPDQQLPTS